VLLANIIAWPVAYYIMNKWLEGFAYKISVSIFLFIGAGLLALGIAQATISFQVVKVSLTNPADVLKYE
jgi:putative ABC transport system permease protein